MIQAYPSRFSLTDKHTSPHKHNPSVLLRYHSVLRNGSLINNISHSRIQLYAGEADHPLESIRSNDAPLQESQRLNNLTLVISSLNLHSL